MSTTTIDGFEEDTVILDDAGNSVHLTKDAAAVAGISEQAADPADIHDNTFLIDGLLLNKGSAIFVEGDRDTVTIGETGRLFAGPKDLPGTSAGIFLTGDANVVTNSGTIRGGDFDPGILALGSTGTQIHNSGEINGGSGIDYEGDQGTVTNESGGLIAGGAYAIGSDSDEAGTITVVNHGSLVGKAGIAIASPTETMLVTNDGTIKGDVDFGIGDDRLDSRGGTIHGAINGGGGDDTLIVDNPGYQLTELANQGNDTVKSTVTYALGDNVEQLYLIGNSDIDATGNSGDNFLRGGKGDNTLSGLAGFDFLFGGKGNDVLTGGTGADTFQFRGHFGRDAVTDFVTSGPEHDALDMSWVTSIDNFSDLIKHHANDVDGNVVIDAGGGNTITLEHVLKAELHSNDILFDVV